MMEITSRQDAKSAGNRFYFTGKLCKRGHAVERYVSNRKCVMCGKLGDKKRYEENPEKEKLRHKKWHKKNPNYQKEYRKKNSEEIKTYNKGYHKANPEKCAEKKARRRALKINALDKTTPREVFHKIEKRKREITEATGIPHHIDHFIPLSKDGMHTPSNLWIIPAAINLQKGVQIWTEEELIDACKSYYKKQGYTPVFQISSNCSRSSTTDIPSSTFSRTSQIE